MARPTKKFLLPGNYDRRVFVGGKYGGPIRPLLDQFANVIRREGLVPVIADEYFMPDEQIHDQTLALLHACRYAVFEVSEMSGALMEIERTRDYGTETLLLFHGASAADWRLSRMLNSFVQEDDTMVTARGYMRTLTAIFIVRDWLRSL